ncbi:MAG: hypothetical protein RI968_817, partial [Pseudomonadota bacterium]
MSTKISQNRQSVIEQAWEDRATIGAGTAPQELREAVESVIGELDAGSLRVAERTAQGWVTHQWIKKAVLL